MAKALNMVLLAAIAAGTTTRVSEADGKPLVAAGLIEVNTADVVDGLALARVTDAGTAALAAQATNGAADAPKAGAIEIEDAIPMPTGSRTRGEGVYPFDKLEVGQSFHVPKTAENPEPAIRLSSSVSGAMLRYSPVLKNADGTPQTESKERPIYERTADGKGYAKGADGKRIVTGTETVTVEKRGDPERTFKVRPVGADDPKGEGARCWRTA